MTPVGREPDPAPSLDGFTYRGVIGVGGFSTVFLYEQRRPQRLVAVKVLVGSVTAEEEMNSFESEANNMAAVSAHPNIVTVFDADVTKDGKPYLVMEYCPGGNMGDLARRTRLPVPEVLEIGVQLAAALESAHQAGILHRDIKPANVVKTASSRPALTDFGISILAGHETSGPLNEGLSIPWAPPEAFAPDGVLDVRSDVYSLGALVYTLLTGRSPYEGSTNAQSAADLIPRIREGNPPPTERFDVPSELEALLNRSLSVGPGQRPQSAHEFAIELQSVQQSLGLVPTRIEVLQSPVVDLPTGTQSIGSRSSIQATSPRGLHQDSCPSCGAHCDAGRRFCRRCGSPLGKGSREVSGASAEMLTPSDGELDATPWTPPPESVAPRTSGSHRLVVASAGGVLLVGIVIAGVVFSQGSSDSDQRLQVETSQTVAQEEPAAPTPTAVDIDTTPSSTAVPGTPRPAETQALEVSTELLPPPTPNRLTAEFQLGRDPSRNAPLGNDYSLIVQWPVPGGQTQVEEVTYLITVREGDAEISTVETTASGRYQWTPVDGALAPRTRYSVTVTAETEAGEGIPSERVFFRTPRGYVAPTPKPARPSTATPQSAGGSSPRPSRAEITREESASDDVLPFGPGGLEDEFAD